MIDEYIIYIFWCFAHHSPAQYSPGYYRYGDECMNGRVSLLHFCVFFMLAGTIVITVGLVQYKEDAELFKYRQTIVIIGCVSLSVGMLDQLDCISYFLISSKLSM